jgi:hypothetical protein
MRNGRNSKRTSGRLVASQAVKACHERLALALSGWPGGASTIDVVHGEAEAGADAGVATPLTLLLGMALVVLPVMVLVLSVPYWEQRAVDAQDAARAAVRALASATSSESGELYANQVVATVMEGDGLPAGEFEASYSGDLVPGGVVKATVSVEVPVGVFPGLGAMGDLRYSASSEAHIDSYEGSAVGGALRP